MGIISSLLRTGLVLGAVYTAYQATQQTKEQTGGFDKDTFVRNFKSQAAENTKKVAEVVKDQVAGKKSKKSRKAKKAPVDATYRVSDEGENGYAYKDAAKDEPKAAPAEDKVNDVFETIKEKAPEVIDKVQNFVEDVRENAPEYKAKAQEFVEDVKEAAKKALDTEPVKEEKTEDKPAEAEEKPAEPKDGEQ